MSNKAEFSGPLDVRFTETTRKGRRVWMVLSPFTFTGELNGEPHVTIVTKGFLTDFASVPPVVRKFIQPVGPYAKAAVVHDYRYKHKLGDRKTADRIFLEAMRVSGVSWPTRSIMYRAVRLFGWKGWGK